MKPNIIATYTSIPALIRVSIQRSKALIAVAGAIAVLSVIIALSQDTERFKSRYFLNDGMVLKAERILKVKWSDVYNAYPYTESKAQDNNIDK